MCFLPAKESYIVFRIPAEDASCSCESLWACDIYVHHRVWGYTLQIHPHPFGAWFHLQENEVVEYWGDRKDCTMEDCKRRFQLLLHINKNTTQVDSVGGGSFDTSKYTHVHWETDIGKTQFKLHLGSSLLPPYFFSEMVPSSGSFFSFLPAFQPVLFPLLEPISTQNFGLVDPLPVFFLLPPPNYPASSTDNGSLPFILCFGFSPVQSLLGKALGFSGPLSLLSYP